ncbi:MAG: FAD-dependent oxidoreductase, partial [Sneathiellales bacterium]|nr:FAD-dependent oxidoreductase [Sneathiellales bacterium]
LRAVVPPVSHRDFVVLHPHRGTSLPQPEVNPDAVGLFAASSAPNPPRFHFGGLNVPASSGPTDLLLRGAHALLPGLEFETKKTWLGHRPATADSLPVIGPAPSSDQIYFAYGHHHVGLTAGPKTGRLVARHVMNTQPNTSIEAYRADRFA